MTYFLRISSAILPCSIWSKASATASQVGVVVLSNQQISISVLQRSSSPRWFFSIVPSWWLFKSRFTPSECQSKTDFKAFLSPFKVGVSGAVGWQNARKKRWSCLYQRGRSVGKLTLCQSLQLSRVFSHHVGSFRPKLHFSGRTQTPSSLWAGWGLGMRLCEEVKLHFWTKP